MKSEYRIAEYPDCFYIEQSHYTLNPNYNMWSNLFGKKQDVFEKHWIKLKVRFSTLQEAKDYLEKFKEPIVEPIYHY